MFRQLLQFLVLFLCSTDAIAQTFPENINLDTAHFPFTFGVTSGDPTIDRVRPLQNYLQINNLIVNN